METGMDTFLSALTLLTFVVCLDEGVNASNVVGYCGGSVSIKCEYDTQYGRKNKYFCQGEQSNCKELIRTNVRNKWIYKDRYSLLDNGTHYFAVRISDLAQSDAGRYHCGVRGEELIQSEVNLEVKDDLFPCGETLTRTGYMGDSMNVTCPYLSTHTQAAKFLCKAFRNQGCDYRVSTQEDRTWVHSDKVSLYDDREKRVFTAVLGKLGKLDRGNYWCGVETGREQGDGYKSLIQKVQLAMSDMQPTSPVTLQPATSPHATDATAPETTTGLHPLLVTTKPTSTLLIETSTSQPRRTETDTTTRAGGQGSPKPGAVLFSTAVPITESSSSLWHMVIYAILALLVVVVLSALLLYVITRGSRAKAIDSAPCLVSMDALWSSRLLPEELEHPMDPVASDPSEASPPETNTFLPTPAD